MTRNRETSTTPSPCEGLPPLLTRRLAAPAAALLFALTVAGCDGGGETDGGPVDSSPDADAGGQPDAAADADATPDPDSGAGDGSPDVGEDAPSDADASDAELDPEDAAIDAPSDADADADASDAEADAEVVVGLCINTCTAAGDGICDDGSEGSGPRLCDYGTDCSDCGPRDFDPEACVPDCTHRECGSDGCRDTCGSGCGDGAVCAPGGKCVDWMPISPGGWFEMGSGVEEVGRSGTELQHDVILTHDFVMDALEVRLGWVQALAPDVLGSHYACGEDCPAHALSWHGAAIFCNTLSRGAGLEQCYDCSADEEDVVTCDLAAHLASPYECDGYRLPTEAEWEYAARAGTSTATYNGDLPDGLVGCDSPHPILDPIAWFCGNAISPVSTGILEPNDFGLYDMLGNVAEWVHDWYWPYSDEAVADPWGPSRASHRAARGGDYFNNAQYARAPSRASWLPDDRWSNVGLRVVRTVFE